MYILRENVNHAVRLVFEMVATLFLIWGGDGWRKVMIGGEVRWIYYNMEELHVAMVMCVIWGPHQQQCTGRMRHPQWTDIMRCLCFIRSD